MRAEAVGGALHVRQRRGRLRTEERPLQRAVAAPVRAVELGAAALQVLRERQLLGIRRLRHRGWLEAARRRGGARRRRRRCRESHGGVEAAERLRRWLGKRKGVCVAGESQTRAERT